MQTTQSTLGHHYASRALTLCLLGTGLLYGSTAAAQNFNFTENFSAPAWTVGDTLGSKNGWVGNDGGAFDVEIKDNRGSTQSLYLLDNGGGSAYAAYDFGNNLTSGNFSFGFSRATGGTFGLTFRTAGADPTSPQNRTFGLIIENNTFKLRAFNGDTHSDVSSVTFANAGYAYSENFDTFHIAFDTLANTVSISLNSTITPFLTYSNDAIANWAWGHVTLGAGWSSGTDISAYFDTIAVSGTMVPEPATWAAIGAGLSLLAVGILRRRRA